MIRLPRYIRDEHGASAAEFALVLPVLLFLIFGTLQFGMLLYTSVQLHWATEDSARCASVRLDCRTGGVSSGAVTATTVQAYANARYKGLSPATFAYAATGACYQTAAGSSGKTVTGTSTFNFNLGFYQRSIALSATACYP